MTLVVSQEGKEGFSSIQAAVDALPENAGTEPRIILVKKGIYRERVAIHRDHVRLIGEDPEKTVITWSSYALEMHPDGTERTTFRSWTLMTTGEDIRVENLTIRNDAGDGEIVGQAVAVYAAGDRGAWKNCRMIAHQDTLYCGPLRTPDVTEDLGSRTGRAEQAPRVQDGPLTRSRQYFEKCLIQGDVDFIFGCYRCWFEDCTLFMNKRGGWYTAANTHMDQPWGFVFHRCLLTGECPEGRAYLGRPWRAGARTLFLDCEMDEHVAPEGFTDWDETRVVTSRCGEGGTRGARADQAPRHPFQKRLTETEQKGIAPETVLDGWNGGRGEA